MAAKRIDLDPECWLELDENWLTHEDASALHAALVRELTWEQRSIVLFGREVVQPRLIAWAGTVGYRYSGQTLPAQSAPPPLQTVWRAVAAHARSEFNHVLVNRYRDGRDSMGFHSDDETELGPNPVVASLSLGAPRRFVIAEKKKRGARVTLDLAAGALLVMRGATQHRFRHAVPKSTVASGERVSLTFRHVLHSR